MRMFEFSIEKRPIDKQVTLVSAKGLLLPLTTLVLGFRIQRIYHDWPQHRLGAVCSAYGASPWMGRGGNIGVIISSRISKY